VSTTGVVHQNIGGLQFGWQRSYGCLHGRSVAHVKHQNMHRHGCELSCQFFEPLPPTPRYY
jgi:hypothetical protein